MRGSGRRWKVAALLCALAVAGCTADAEVPPPPTPAPTSQTSTESPEERQERLDYEAAEKAYRTFRAEYNRVLRAGGAKEPTQLMKETAGGEYLRTFVEVIRGFRDLGSRSVGREVIVFIRREGYTPEALVLKVCEDDRQIRTIRKKGNNGRGDLRIAQLEVKKQGSAWKVWSGSGKVVKSC